jgi:hypothetical protein
MTYYADLSPCDYSQWAPNALAIGWLEHGQFFPTGPTSREFRRALLRLLSFRVGSLMWCGGHRCDLCLAEGRVGPDTQYSSGALLVPSAECGFLAPTLIGHYVIAHQYQPSEVFQRAVLECPDLDEPRYLDLALKHARLWLEPPGHLVAIKINPLPGLYRSTYRGGAVAPLFDPILDRDLEKGLGLSPRLSSALLTHEVVKVGHLIQLNEPQLLELLGSPQDVSTVHEALERHGLVIGQSLPGWPEHPAALARKRRPVR